jgi:TPR repeat protein
MKKILIAVSCLLPGSIFAAQMSPDALIAYGELLEGSDNSNNLLPNLTEAAHCFKLAADQNSAKGKYYFGTCLFNGEGVDQNLEEAAHYFKMSADQGYEPAQEAYGECLLRGHGVAANFEEAIIYLQASAQQKKPNIQR